MNYIYQNSRTEAGEIDRSGLERLLGELQDGDCLAVAQLSCAADSAAALLELLDELQSRGIRFRSVAEGLDTGTPAGVQAVALLRAILQMDAGRKSEASREDAPAKGRKPIEVDEDMFDQILERWKNGEITARQAMAELNLKPNTFYRRVKEREGKATDSLLDAAKKLGKGIMNTVTEGSEELQHAAGKLAAEYDLSSLSDTVKKNFTAAGKVLSSRMDSLSRDFQEAMQRCEKKPEAEQPTEGPQEAPAGEPAQPEAEHREQPAEEAPAAPQAAEASQAGEEAPAEPAGEQQEDRPEEHSQEPHSPEYL